MTMRFAEYVLDQIYQHGWIELISYEYVFFGNYNRRLNSFNECWENHLYEKDDWNLYFDGFIFKRAILVRGPEKFKIDLTEDEIVKFLEFHKLEKIKKKQDHLNKKLERDRKQVIAQDWP